MLTLLAGEESDQILRAAIETFVSARLCDAGIWKHPRESDGIGAYRFVERTATRARIVGRIWTIADQVEHHFWLDLERGEDALVWSLHFEVDPDGRSERRMRHMVDALEDGDQVRWLHEARGRLPIPAPPPAPER